MTATILERWTRAETPELTAADRCDQCGARAWVRATVASGGQLHFCAHHASKHLPALIASGAHVLDERHFLLEED